MKQKLNAYYEETVIPSINLACLTCLQFYVAEWLGFVMGQPTNITLGTVLGTFFVFLLTISFVDACTALKDRINKALTLSIISIK